MSLDTMTIPEEIKVGFNKRNDCYSGKLGYVIYKDTKNVWRKEKSWESWRSKDIDVLFIKNEPIDGFVLNKKVGGVKESWGWNARLEKVRVFDPRGFEFEITVPNLLFILRETDCSRGKGLEGKFVYAWSGTELVLVPTNSQEYTESVKHTKLQTFKVKAKDLVVGHTYLTKDHQKLIYIGRHLVHCSNFESSHNLPITSEEPEKKYVFYSEEDKSFDFRNDVSKIAQVISDVVDENIAEYLEYFGKKNVELKVVEIFTEEKEEKEKTDKYYYYDRWFASPVPEEPGCWYLIRDYDSIHQEYTSKVKFANGVLTSEHIYKLAYKDRTVARIYWHVDPKYTYVTPTKLRLRARTSDGEVYVIGSGSIYKEDRK